MSTGGKQYKAIGVSFYRLNETDETGGCVEEDGQGGGYLAAGSLIPAVVVESSYISSIVRRIAIPPTIRTAH
jgi:hypothetical protein